MGWDTLNLIETIGAFVIALSVLDLPRERHLHAPSAARSRGTTRGTAARSSGRSRRRRPSTTSPRSRRSRRATTGGTASTPRTPRAGWCGCRPAAPTTASRRGRRRPPATTVGRRRHARPRAGTATGTASTCRRRRSTRWSSPLGLPFLGYAAVFLEPVARHPRPAPAPVRRVRLGPRARHGARD